jgi:hypothetical protein
MCLSSNEAGGYNAFVFSTVQNVIAFVLPKEGHVDKLTNAMLVDRLKSKLPW